MTKTVSPVIQNEQRVWVKPDSLQFFRTHRNVPNDLYLSERLFLPEVLPQVATCLDIGCAAGGFSRIMRSFNPSLAYTGMDVNEEFVAIARDTYPDCRFEVGDGVHFSTPPGSYDLVFSSGVLHLNSRYRDILRAAYRQTRRFLLCDFRLTWGPSQTGSFRLDFDATGSVTADLPYVVVNLEELLEDLCALNPRPAAVTLRGYPHSVSSMARGVPPEVIMAFVLLERAESTRQPPRVVVEIRSESSWKRLYDKAVLA